MYKKIILLLTISPCHNFSTPPPPLFKLYPSSSVLATPLHLRHFSDPHGKMSADWEKLFPYHYNPYYVDARVVYESNSMNTEVTSYKNITIFDVNSIVDAEIALHIFDSAILVLSC